MNAWAAHRRFIIVLILGGVILVVSATVLAASLYHPPSCVDNVENQDEMGIDCGGSCAYLCTAAQVPPVVLFTQLLHTSSGRVDLVALIENNNSTAAARSVPFRIQMYGTDRTLVKELSGMVDLPPHTTMPIFIPGVVSSGQNVAHAFLEIASSSPRWFTMSADSRVVPVSSHTIIGGTPSAPRITATLTNSSLSTLTNIPVIVFVRGLGNNVIAASATIVAQIPPQGEADAIVTWNEPFVSTPLSVEVLPVVPLPTQASLP